MQIDTSFNVSYLKEPPLTLFEKLENFSVIETGVLWPISRAANTVTIFPSCKKSRQLMSSKFKFISTVKTKSFQACLVRIWPLTSTSLLQGVFPTFLVQNSWHRVGRVYNYDLWPMC